jgi:hypothetical protein
MLSNHPNGSIFIKKFTQFSKKDDEVKKRIINIIKENFNNLVQNQNGNIVFFTILNVIIVKLALDTRRAQIPYFPFPEQILNTLNAKIFCPSYRQMF